MTPPSTHRPPGPKPHFPIGNFPLGHKNPLATFEKWAHEFGDIFYYRAGWIHVYFLNHPEYVESVLVTQYQNFMKDHVVRNSRWIFGDGLLTNEGASWLRQRRTFWAGAVRAVLTPEQRAQFDENFARLESDDEPT